MVARAQSSLPVGGTPLRLCLFAGSILPDLGGQELVVDRLARELSSRGHRVCVVAPESRRSGPPDDDAFPYRVYRHPRLPQRHEGVLGYQRFLLAAHRRENFEIVHCHGVYPQAFLAPLARPELGAVLLATSHGCDLRPSDVAFYGPTAGRWTVWGLRQMDALVAINRWFQREFEALGRPGATVVEIPHGVDLAALASAEPRPEDLDAAIRPGGYALFLGRLVGQKGVPLLLEALALLPDGGGVQLVVAGEGRRRADLERRAAELGLTDRVRFLGWVDGARKRYLLQNALCAVVPSSGTEAFGLVVVESFAAGRPVIASRIPALDERVGDGRNGLLVEPERPEALAAAWRRLLDEPGLAAALGREARSSAAPYDWGRIADRHLELYASLLAARPRSVN